MNEVTIRASFLHSLKAMEPPAYVLLAAPLAEGLQQHASRSLTRSYHVAIVAYQSQMLLLLLCLLLMLLLLRWGGGRSQLLQRSCHSLARYLATFSCNGLCLYRCLLWLHLWWKRVSCSGIQ